ncbi:hypothetical protein C8R42DRAFT_641440 [Lentinula raphanica]|nr:hypothetical protein C8R42DRAFT_641440 [Lentinula raphanica]
MRTANNDPEPYIEYKMNIIGKHKDSRTGEKTETSKEWRPSKPPQTLSQAPSQASPLQAMKSAATSDEKISMITAKAVKVREISLSSWRPTDTRGSALYTYLSKIEMWSSLNIQNWSDAHWFLER